MTTSRIALLAALACLATPALADPRIAGHATTTDGDTIRLDGTLRIRLFGIDAPEAGQTCLDADRHAWACGERATAAMRAMLARDAAVTCERKDTDRYGRTVAICANSEGDLGGRMVEQGLAVDYEHYSHGFYRIQQNAARAARLGMWVGEFDMPWDWRHRREGQR